MPLGMCSNHREKAYRFMLEWNSSCLLRIAIVHLDNVQFVYIFGVNINDHQFLGTPKKLCTRAFST